MKVGHMLSETLTEGLERYRIGQSVRSLRKDKGLSLAELGKHTGLSGTMLSKVERGDLYPTLPTLLRIALVFGVGLEHFFIEVAKEPTIAVVRKKERKRLPDKMDATSPTYFFESLDYPATNRKMDSFLAEFQSGSGPSDPHSHDGAEHIFVVAGQLTIVIEKKRIRLETGDAIYFDSSLPHTYASGDSEHCSALITVSPSSERSD